MKEEGKTTCAVNTPFKRRRKKRNGAKEKKEAGRAGEEWTSSPSPHLYIFFWLIKRLMGRFIGLIKG